MKSFFIIPMLMIGIAQAQEIGVKGLNLGMSAESFTSKFNNQVYDDGSAGIRDEKFTVAGEQVLYDSITLSFDNNRKLGHIMFFIYPHQFDKIKAGFSSKYSMRCTTSIVGNAVGQKFDQEKCIYNNQNGDTLIITKRIDRDTGIVEMISKAWQNQEKDKNTARLKKAKNDM